MLDGSPDSAVGVGTFAWDFAFGAEWVDGEQDLVEALAEQVAQLALEISIQNQIQNSLSKNSLCKIEPECR